jgi:myo-inositol-1-phosphate synthase
MRNYDDKYTFVLADEPEPDMGEVVRVLKESGTQVVLNYLPVGSEQATRF